MPHALPGVLTRSRSICFATNELSSPFSYFMYFFRDLAALLKMFSDFLTVGSTTPHPLIKEKSLTNSGEFRQRRLPGLFYLMQRVASLERFSHLRGSSNNVKRIPIVFIFIRWILPTKVVAIHVEGRLYDRDARERWLESRSIRNVNLNAAARLPGVLLKRRKEDAGSKRDAGKIELREFVRELVSIDVRRTHQFKRPRSSPPFGHLRTFKMHAPGKDRRTVNGRHVRRRQHPRAVCFVVPKLA